MAGAAQDDEKAKAVVAVQRTNRARGAADAFSLLEEEFEQLLNANDQFDRRRLIWDFFRGPITKAWTSFTTQIEAGVRSAAKQCETAIAERNTRRDSQTSAARNAAENAASPLRATITQLENERDSFVQSSTRFLIDFWTEIGSALNLLEPQHALAEIKAALGSDVASATLAVPGQEIAAPYRNARNDIARLPKIGRSSRETVILRLGLLVSVLLFAGSWWLTSNLVIAGIAFIWAIGGSVLLLQLGRARVSSAYRTLLEATAHEQRRWELSCAAAANKLRENIAGILANASVQTNAANDERARNILQIKDRFRAEITRLSNLYRQNFDSCSELVTTSSEKLAELHRSFPDIYDASEKWSDSPNLTGLPLAVRTAFRLGTIPRWGLAPVSDSCLELLGLPAGSGTIAGLGIDDNVEWGFASRRSLAYLGKNPTGADGQAFPTDLIARILHQLPAGKVHFTFFDPIGLGKNFSGFLKLADYSDQLIGGKAWSDKEHIRRRLKDLIEHIETVTQKYLRRDFPDIDAYNLRAGEIAEPYRVLVVADYPEAFDEDTNRDLVRVVQNGPRCGVYAVLCANISRPMPHGVSLDPILPFCDQLVSEPGSKMLILRAVSRSAETAADVQFLPDPAASDAQIDKVTVRFGEGAKHALRVEVPYSRLLEMAGASKDECWTRQTIDGIEVPLGPTGAKKVQLLRLGQGLAHHALIVGRPGSGKSNLLHVFITGSARLFSPEELQFYLIDFKKGVEFKCYADARLPHAKVIAVESEREFGLSVLEGLDAELTARGERFKKSGSANITEHRKKTGEVVSRIILAVDEFQEFFTREDKIKREAGVFFDRLVRQGRAFGVHLLLGSQSLSNSGLERSTQDQMAVRIALQCSEQDSKLILADDNVAARLLSRPGEAIYNDAAGLVEANNLFQVALFSEQDRRRELEFISKWSQGKSTNTPIIFEGHEAARIEESTIFEARPAPPRTNRTIDLWLGQPVALKPTTTVTIKRQSGRNLLVLSRDEPQGIGIMLATLLSIAMQSDPGMTRILILDLTTADSAWADHPETFASSASQRTTVFGRRELKSAIAQLSAEVERRTENNLAGEPSLFLTIMGIHRARELREDERGQASSLSMDLDTPPATSAYDALARILRDGPEVGVHTLIWCDTAANLDRVVDRGGLSELGLRIAGPLSSQESHRIFDDEIASHIDKPFRMIKYDDDQVSTYEIFRPFAIPSRDWLAGILAKSKWGSG